jgi:hypothetical protein
MNSELTAWQAKERAVEYLSGAHYQPIHPILRALLAECTRLEAILSDGKALMKNYEELQEKVTDLENQNGNLHIEHDVMFMRIRDANGQYTPNEVSRLIDSEIAERAARMQAAQEVIELIKYHRTSWHGYDLIAVFERHFGLNKESNNDRRPGV